MNGFMAYSQSVGWLHELKNFVIGIAFRNINKIFIFSGCYAFRLPDENEEHGIWVSYEDPDVVKEKATYAKHNGLGGIAFNDLTLDDFKGLCTTTKYPLLIAGRSNL